VAVQVANGLGDMVVVIAYGDLRRVTAALLVESLELACSLGGLRGAQSAC